MFQCLGGLKNSACKDMFDTYKSANFCYKCYPRIGKECIKMLFSFGKIRVFITTRVFFTLVQIKQKLESVLMWKMICVVRFLQRFQKLSYSSITFSSKVLLLAGWINILFHSFLFFKSTLQYFSLHKKLMGHGIFTERKWTTEEKKVKNRCSMLQLIHYFL